MTYKLDPSLEKIVSPVRLVMGDETREFENGTAACKAVFDHRYVVAEIRAVEGTVEIGLEEADVPAVSPIGEETFF